MVQIGLNENGDPVITAYMVPDEGEFGFTDFQVKEAFLGALMDGGQEKEKQKVLHSYFNGRGVQMEASQQKPSKQ